MMRIITTLFLITVKLFCISKFYVHKKEFYKSFIEILSFIVTNKDVHVQKTSTETESVISSTNYILQNGSLLLSTNSGILYRCNPKCYQKMISLLWNIASWFQHTRLRDIFSSDVIVLMNFAFNGITPKSNTVT